MVSNLLLIYSNTLTQLVHNHGQDPEDVSHCTTCYKWLIDRQSRIISQISHELVILRLLVQMLSDVSYGIHFSQREKKVFAQELAGFLYSFKPDLK